MVSGIVPVQQGKAVRRDSPGPGAAAGQMQNLGWVPVAVGTAAIVAGLGGRRKGAVALGLAAFAGVAAVGAIRGARFEPGKTGSKRQGAEAEVERSITIGKTVDELRDYWLDPRTLPQIMAAFATVHATSDGRMHWKVEGPFGRACEWDTETVDRSADAIGWRSLPGGGIQHEGRVRFHPAPAGRGTVVTLHVRFDPPGGVLGEGLLKLIGSTPLAVVADGVLRRFKNLVETGEIPTTVRQPAARADTH
jgi:uncharacterized membrane protein